MIKKTLFFRRMKDRLFGFFSAFAVILAVGAMLWIISTVFVRGFEVFSFHFLTAASRPYGAESGGIANALLGTLLITSGAAVVSIPCAVCAGIFLSEYKEFTRLAEILRFCANVMMGMPSVLVGLFVYVVIVVPCGHFSGFAASLALAIIMFPVIMRTTEDMLSMVPDSVRESALALGMTRTRATLAVLCRSAKNGLLTGILLSLSRVSGETAPLLFTAMFSDSWPTGYFTTPTANLPVLITEYSTNSPFASLHAAGWGAALAVTFLVLALNVFTRIFFREKK